jgi:hypothetical protein
VTESADNAPPLEGTGILRLVVGGTLLLGFTGLLAAIFEGMFTGVYVAVAALEFVVGTIVFGLAFLRAIDRSRTEAIGVGGLFFASGTAPARVQLILMLSLTAQIAISMAVAWVHLYTALAFGVLAPMWALGLTGLWVAAYGTFPERAPEPTRTGRRDADRRAHRASNPPGKGRSKD